MKFFRLFRKKLSPEECSSILLRGLSESLKRVDGDPLLGRAEVDTKLIKSELIYLTGFAYEYGITMYLRNSAERDAVLENFFVFVAVQGSQEGRESEFFEAMKIRHDRYLAAVQGDSSKITNSVGGEFARFCGYSQDIAVIGYGMIEFAGTLKMLEQLFNEYEVKQKTAL